ncbi:purine-nucleoside phosphorylase [Clostridiaceae bacterium OttesenSCG-928-D20]|nr:purine-nucleoside phosphorylase [Clostridiaceae bacterium OttesenSCG-928-D20]
MTPTPHISAQKGDIAKTVLMPGDPNRAKFIAETFLEDARLINNTRGVQGRTGLWKGVPVTVMASGMGMPSMSIYSWELFSFYEVENIIRIGSAGAFQDYLNIMDVVCGVGACTDSSYAHQFGLNGSFAPIASYGLIQKATEAAEKLGVSMHYGNLLSSDHFYSDGSDSHDLWKKMGVLAVEMECAALYMNAARLGKNALGICTISDHLYKEQYMTADERETSFTQMMEIALDTAVLAN